MRLARLLIVTATCGLAVSLFQFVAVAQAPAPAAPAAIPAYQRFLSPASPLELVAARKAERVAWVAFEEGKRNAYTAAAPAFAPVRLTSFLDDDGIDMSAIQISADGAVVAFVRGTAPNRDGCPPCSLRTSSPPGRSATSRTPTSLGGRTGRPTRPRCARCAAAPAASTPCASAAATSRRRGRSRR